MQKPLQLSGLAAFILSTLCILLAFSLFQVPGTTGLTLLSLFISGIVFGLLFWQLEKRNLNPLISPALTKNRHFLGLTPCLIVTILFSGVTYLMPLYLVNSHHLDQFTAGMIMTEPALLSIIVAPIGGSLADRHGSIRVSSIALTLAAAGFLVFVTFNPVTVIIVIVAGMVVNRVSTAAFFGPKGKLIMNPCPEGTSGTVPGS
ncbi:MAG: MFS transporter [Methanomicrobiales archaeon]